jgi:hypothetical protein
MTWGGPAKKSGWGRVTEGAGKIEQRLYTVIRAVQELVPGGVLRAGKLHFGQGAGWLLSITEQGAGVVDIGDEDHYLRFDGQDFTWRTPLTELSDDGTLSAVNAFFSGILDAPTLDLEMMKLSFQSISWAQFAIYESFSNAGRRVDDSGVQEALLGRGYIAAPDDATPDTVYGWRSAPWTDITTVYSGSSSEVGLNYLQDSACSWFADQYNGFELLDSAATLFTILDTVVSTTRLVVSGTPAAGAYTIRGKTPHYCVPFLSYSDSSNGGYGALTLQARFNAPTADFQTFYQTNAINNLGGIAPITNGGHSYDFRVRLTTDAQARSPRVYKLLICTDPSPWGTP